MNENPSVIKSVVTVTFEIPLCPFYIIINNDFIEKTFENNIKTMKKNCAFTFNQSGQMCKEKLFKRYCEERVPVSNLML